MTMIDTSHPIPPQREDKPTNAAAHERPALHREALLGELDLDDLRAMRRQLSAQETKVSFWERIIQGRLDVLQAESDVDPVTHLGRVLTDAPTLPRRPDHLSVAAVDDVPPLVDLTALWTRQVDHADPAACEVLAADLTDAGQRLSEVHSGLFHRIDTVTGELIARYREDPHLALVALPREPISLGL
jgi:hypothetical protein